MEMEGNHTLLSLGARHCSSKHRHTSFTWIERPPEKKFNITKAQTSTIDKWAQRIAQMKKEKVGGPSGMVG